MTDPTNKTRTITLTGRRPVEITDRDWPIYAAANKAWADSPYEFQANRTRSTWIRVRLHADGRAIVYGTHDYSSTIPSEADERVRVGHLHEPGADLVEAIEEVGRLLVDQGVDSALVRAVVAACVADLPAERI